MLTRTLGQRTRTRASSCRPRAPDAACCSTHALANPPTTRRWRPERRQPESGLLFVPQTRLLSTGDVMALADSNQGSSGKGQCFTTTHWSVVLTAGHNSSRGAQEALEKLCRTYWYPLYAYVRRQGNSPEDAEDLTQEFFARFLEKQILRNARPERGCLRSFLLTSTTRF